MTTSQLANYMSIPIAVICLIISVVAFNMYRLSRKDMLFVLGLAMASISIGTFVGIVGEIHIGGNTYNTEFARAFGACCGGLFIFLSSLVKSQKQMQQLKRWQIIAAFLFVIVAALTPLYPPIKSPMISFALNGCRILIYGCAFIRYAILYSSKSTRFSLIMSIGFLVLVAGYALNVPGIFQTTFAFITIVAASVRIIAYVTLLIAYTVG